ncbi:thioredoxin family protein [Pseudothermotoga sp.]|uniref:thioredoxin family protein n=1 Tax=Pseudothermotoga sp. TaxID=2033661 RepID=UPI000E8BD4F4|nr:thioredoxin family protein [Pseudothermotoga sp.]HBJ80734.1 thioredoxin family protein [Pseudothermotoga sp.]
MAKKIEILGKGCARCKQTEKIVRMALEELNVDAVIEKVEDIAEIIARGVVSTPAIAVNGKIVLSGKIPTLEEEKKLIQIG